MSQKLLVADDSITVQRVVELTFSTEGVDVVAVGDGEQAIAAIERERPDLVLADVSMPGRDGYEVAEFVKRTPHLSRTPVVLMTGAFEQIDESRARAVGCDGVLAKPFEPHMVVSLVHQLLDAAAPAAVPGGTAAEAAPRTGFPFEPGANVSATTSSLDDYFDRLDEALASAPPPTPRSPEPPPSAQPRTSGDPAASPRASAGGASSLADAFSALLAEELGEARLPSERAVETASEVPRAVTPTTAPPPGSAVVVTDELVDAVTRRVIERLSDQVVREVVASTVLDVAERLVREEIEKIKAEA